jgi:hypothetical protein
VHKVLLQVLRVVTHCCIGYKVLLQVLRVITHCCKGHGVLLQGLGMSTHGNKLTTVQVSLLTHEILVSKGAGHP